MVSKSKQIQLAIFNDDTKKAVSIASKFCDRSEDTQIFKCAQSAINNPSFYKQLGKDPDKIISDAINLLKLRFCNG